MVCREISPKWHAACGAWDYPTLRKSPWSMSYPIRQVIDSIFLSDGCSSYQALQALTTARNYSKKQKTPPSNHPTSHPSRSQALESHLFSESRLHKHPSQPVSPAASH